MVTLSMFRELGPVLTGLMVAGRVGAAMSAEIGTMKVTQQIDALRALAVHPVDYLVVPRALAMLISMPLAGRRMCAVAGSSLLILWPSTSSISRRSISSTICRSSPRAATSPCRSIKGFVFANIIVFISCLEGLECEGWRGRGRTRHHRNRGDLLALHLDCQFLSHHVPQYPLSCRTAMSVTQSLDLRARSGAKIGRQEILRGFSLDMFSRRNLGAPRKSGGARASFLRHLDRLDEAGLRRNPASKERTSPTWTSASSRRYAARSACFFRMARSSTR